MAELKSFQFNINPVKHRALYLWYTKVKEQEGDVFSAIIRYALENYYESGGQCVAIAKLHKAELPAEAGPVKINLYIGNGAAAKLLETMKTNGITKTKVIRAVLEGGIEFIPDTEKESIYLPPKRDMYSGILMEMSKILQKKTDGNLKPAIKESVIEPIPKKIEPMAAEPEKRESLIKPQAAHPDGTKKRKRAAALSGKIG